MALLLTHQKNRESDRAGWHEREILNVKKIAELENPDENAGDEPTRSIPSPFAPMHLVREAMLQYVDLKGQVSPDARRVISDALDVGVLFFELAERSGQVDALRFAWESTDPKSAGYVPAAERLTAALRLFRREDGDQYGLNDTDQLTLLTVKNEPHRVFGGTCPETMFFAAPGAKPWAQIASIGDDVLFDHRHALLHERADDYVRWFYALFAELRNAGITDTAFCRYLAYVRERELPEARPALNREIAARLNEPDGAYYREQYRPVTDRDGYDVVLARGVDLRGQRAELDDDIASSFHMRVADDRRHARMPLAIPQFATGASGYVLLDGEAYNRDKHRPPHRDFAALDERTLPGLGTKKYPYLTTDDFLEPTLLRVPYPIDDRFYASVRHRGGVTDEVELHDYLLPLKPLFFKYFSAADLLSEARGTPGVTVGKSGEAYTDFTLEIPLANGGTAAFTRRYFDRAPPTDDGSAGTRLPCTFGLSMLPTFVDRERPEHQRLMLNVRQSASATGLTELELFDTSTGEVAAGTPYEVDWSPAGGDYATATYRPARAFDAIALATTIPGERGVLLPRRRPSPGPEKFVFAVDFGTTNTHVEVSHKSSLTGPLTSPTPLGYTATSHPFVLDVKGAPRGGRYGRTYLANHGLVPYQVRAEELFPTHLSEHDRYAFPIRTASVECGDAIKAAAVATHTIAVPWRYPAQPYERYSVTTNLKWVEDDRLVDTQKRAEAFIETLCLMMRAYVLENQGDLEQVELVWFYPTSMRAFEIDNLADLWQRSFRSYFSTVTAAKVQSLPESLAPVFAWRKQGGVMIEGRPTVVADIGGGTCDVTVFQAEGAANRVKRVSSFKFAGNTIFGDGKGVTANNGFVRAFLDKVVSAKGKTGDPEREAQAELARFAGPNQSIELVNYWFSLDHAIDSDVPEDFDFARILRQTRHMRVPFVVYFAALSYKIATDMAREGIPPPKYLAFSGNGSRMLDYVSTSERTLGRFFDVAFATARGDADDGDALRVFASDDPKPLTCRGGLYYMATQENLDPDWKRTRETSRTVDEVADPTVLDAELAYYEGFVAFFRRFAAAFDLADEIGVDPGDLATATEVLSDLADARGHMTEIAIELTAGMTAGAEISRQMFFFPLERMLPEIARRLARKHSA